MFHAIRRLAPLALLLAVAPAAASTASAALVAPPGLPPGTIYHRVFVNSFDTRVVTVNDFPPRVGDFGDVRGADWNVSRAAFTAGLLPGWNGSDLRYKAILSDLTTDARDHISVQGPIYNMANQLIANDAADLWDEPLANAIRYDEFGVAVPEGTQMWTGSFSNGLTSSDRCGNWRDPSESTRSGDPLSTTFAWLINNVCDCDALNRLYGFSEPLVVADAEAVPEPSTLALAALELVGLALLFRRSCQRHASSSPTLSMGRAGLSEKHCMGIRRGCLLTVILLILVPSFAAAEEKEARLVLPVIRLKPGESKALELRLPDANFNPSDRSMRDFMQVSLLPKEGATDQPKHSGWHGESFNVSGGLTLVWEKDTAGISVQASKDAPSASVDLQVAYSCFTNGKIYHMGLRVIVEGTDFHDPAFQQWEKEVAGLPAEQQVQAVIKKMQRLNPRFHPAELTPKIEGGVVTEITLRSIHLADISPLRPLKGLKVLICNDSSFESIPNIGQDDRLADLAPLSGMALTQLDCSGLRHVSDLSPLRGMALTRLACGNTRIADLSALKGMPLTSLDCSATKVADLAPLKGMQLTTLACRQTPVASLTPLLGAPLTTLDIRSTQVADLAALKGALLTSLDCSDTQVADLTPVAGMPLTSLHFTSTQVADLSPLKGMKWKELDCSYTQVADLTPLAGMPLERLICRNTQVADLSPLKGLPLAMLDCRQTRVADLTPLEGMKLESFLFTLKNVTHGMSTLRLLSSGVEKDAPLHIRSDKPPTIIDGNFWKKYDAGEFGKPMP